MNSENEAKATSGDSSYPENRVSFPLPMAKLVSLHPQSLGRWGNGYVPILQLKEDFAAEILRVQRQNPGGFQKSHGYTVTLPVFSWLVSKISTPPRPSP